MCNLTSHVLKERITGYKVVMFGPDFRYYSAAMGFCYDDYEDEDIPVVKKQMQLATVFYSGILSEVPGSGFRSEMVGRTAIFKKKGAALFLKNEILADLDFSSKYHPKVVKAEVSKDVMKGEYGVNIVFAGRRIKFLEE